MFRMAAMESTAKVLNGPFSTTVHDVSRRDSTLYNQVLIADDIFRRKTLSNLSSYGASGRLCRVSYFGQLHAQGAGIIFRFKQETDPLGSVTKGWGLGNTESGFQESVPDGIQASFSRVEMGASGFVHFHFRIRRSCLYNRMVGRFRMPRVVFFGFVIDSTPHRKIGFRISG